MQGTKICTHCPFETPLKNTATCATILKHICRNTIAESKHVQKTCEPSCRKSATLQGKKICTHFSFESQLQKHGNLRHNFEKKLHLLFADFTNLIMSGNNKKQPCEVVVYNYLFSCCITFELRSPALRSCTLRKFA